MEKLFHANSNQKRAGVVIVLSDIIGYKRLQVKKITRDKKGYYILIKVSSRISNNCKYINN